MNDDDFPFHVVQCASCGGGQIRNKYKPEVRVLCFFCKQDPLDKPIPKPSRWKRFLALFALGLTAACGNAQGLTADNHHPSNFEAEQDLEEAWCAGTMACQKDAGLENPDAGFTLDKCEALFEQSFPYQPGDSSCTQDQVTACDQMFRSTGDNCFTGHNDNDCLKCIGVSP